VLPAESVNAPPNEVGENGREKNGEKRGKDTEKRRGETQKGDKS
jgi:hypothetical protein